MFLHVIPLTILSAAGGEATGSKACRPKCQHLENVACSGGLGVSNWRNWDVCCKVGVPVTGERGLQQVTGANRLGWQWLEKSGPEGPRFVFQQLRRPTCVCFPSEFNPECICVCGIHISKLEGEQEETCI